MKKVLSIIAMATLAVLFCGCNKENAPATGSKSVTIIASMPDDEITTKTALDGTKLLWKETDKIFLSAPNNAETWAPNTATIIPDEISADGKIASFTVSYTAAWENVTTVVGYYGIKAEKVNDYEKGGWYSTFDGAGTSYISYTNPCVQNYYNDRGPNGDYLAMADPRLSTRLTERGRAFQFQNLMSIIKIGVTSSRERTLSSIIVETKEGGDPLSGSFRCWTTPLQVEDPFSFIPAPENESTQPIIDYATFTGTYGTWVKLDNIKVKLTESAQYFYLVVFPGSHTYLHFTFKDKDGDQKFVIWNNRINLESGKIYNFPTIKWD